MKELLHKLFGSLYKPTSTGSGFSYFVRDASPVEKNKIMIKAINGSRVRQNELLRTYDRMYPR